MRIRPATLYAGSSPRAISPRIAFVDSPSRFATHRTSRSDAAPGVGGPPGAFDPRLRGSG